MLVTRYEAIKSMNTIIKLMNDEEAYFDWINYVPDEASLSDLMDIAEDEELYKDCEELFFNICKTYGKYGLYTDIF